MDTNKLNYRGKYSVINGTEIADVNAREAILELNTSLENIREDLQNIDGVKNVTLSIVKTEDNKNVANTANRKLIMNTLGITKDNLSRYIKSFKEKGLLIEGPAEDDLYVNKALIPIVIGDRLQLTIILKIKNETED